MKKAELETLREAAGYWTYMETHNEHVESCLICGRPTKPHTQKIIQMSISGFITDVDVELGDDSQGCFPVGKTCYKNYLKAAKEDNQE
ncbi:hypothetical protein [Parabacteroides sp. PF5-9]|uniref:hypothetical protein n=1 Tax=Parabacteroides sp. PF5-9 TaxID=1742404 RepID=UPI002476A0C3|nr:hypothetical protein [Parabacteroides sp. PF5-9]MDH6358945.1 hypothetical protein [Parabacteroides sp. PF5-9]